MLTTPTHPPTHKHTHTHHDKVITVSAAPCYVVDADDEDEIVLSHQSRPRRKPNKKIDQTNNSNDNSRKNTTTTTTSYFGEKSSRPVRAGRTYERTFGACTYGTYRKKHCHAMFFCLYGPCVRLVRTEQFSPMR